MQQADHFLEECDALAEVIESQLNGRWESSTQFKNWTVNDVLVHLYYWNRMADTALVDPGAFKVSLTECLQALEAGSLRDVENNAVVERGEELLHLWRNHYSDMANRWRDVDPKQRVPWAGPSMSVRSSISARQMETWAHGHEVFDLLGEERVESDRIKNIVILGVNTFGFSYQVRKRKVPEYMPALMLTSPSGKKWEFGEANAGKIAGPAVSFAQVVTQTRNYKDTDLHVEGETAIDWMENAQCFAGPPEPVPRPGSRTMQ